MIFCFNSNYPSLVGSPLFAVEYTDVGENGELNFELLNHHSTFLLEAHQNKMVYTMKIRFNFNETINTNRQAFIEQLKLGSYLISVKISDNGFPSCIKTDTFRLYLGNNHLETSEILLKHLSEVFRNPEDAVIHYVNDKENAYIFENSNFIQGRFDRVHARNSTSMAKRNFLSIFTKNDYIVLLSLIAMLVLAAAFLSIIGCVYFLKSSADDRWNILHVIKEHLKYASVLNAFFSKWYDIAEVATLSDTTSFIISLSFKQYD